MSDFPKKHGGWAEELKKDSKSKKSLDTFEKERFIASSPTSDDSLVPEIDDIQEIEDISSEPPKNSTYMNKELNVEILKKPDINIASMDDTTDLSILIESLEPEADIAEPDDVWHWNNLFTMVAAQISEEK
ncbi:unnamed protein product [Diamesa serratosioi]